MTKINKAQARKLFARGRDIVAIPHKMNPENQFFAMGAVLHRDMGDFDQLADALSYYQCGHETGYYLAYYTEGCA